MQPSRLVVCMLAAFSVLLLSFGMHAQEDEPVIGEGKTVGFEYTLTLSDGTVVESNIGDDAFVYVHGEGQILSSLENALVGMGVDERKSVSLDAEDAYGPVNPEAFQEIPIEQIPENARAVGTQLSSPDFGGPIRVHEVRESTIVLDFNHPLAGQALTFDIRVVSLE